MKSINLSVRIISKDAALERLKKRERGGHKVDSRLKSAINYACIILDGKIQDEASFLSLIWHEIDASRLLTPSGEPRTLGDVASRMVGNCWNFEELCSSSKRSNCDPNWFKTCLRIYNGFDHSKLDWFAVVAVSDDLYRQSPNGSLYIYDGCHKALVYAYMILADKIQYEPVRVLWLLTENGLDDLPTE